MKRETLTENAWSLGLTAMQDGGGDAVMFNVLNEYLGQMPLHILHMRVNGPALRGLLQKIPNPAPASPPAAPSPTSGRGG